MKRTFLLFFLCSSLQLASAQLHRYNTNFGVSPRNFADTIKIEFKNDQIYIPVLIDGQTYRFNLDTGSSQGMLYESSSVPVGQRLGHVISHDANNVSDTIEAVQLPPLRIGHLNLTGYVASVVRHPAQQVDYDGILGFDLFNKGIACKIDTHLGIMVLSDRKGFFDSEPGYRLDYKLKWFVPYVNVSPFMRHVDQALFDTGARQLYVMNKASFDTHAYKSLQVNAQVEGRATGNFTQGTNSTERNDEVVFLHLDRLKWAEFNFRHVHTITTQGASRLGAQLLNYGKVVINPRHRTIVFQPFGTTDSVVVNNRQFGVAFIEKDSQPAIGLIWHKSEAYRRGMRQGDIVLRINDQTINSFQQFTAYPFRDGETYKFLLHDQKGFNKEVTVSR